MNRGPADVFFLVDGYNLISAKLQSLRAKIQALQEKTDGLGDEWEEHSPVGKSRAEMAQEGAFFKTGTGSVHDVLNGIQDSPTATARVVCMGFDGGTIGALFFAFEGVHQGEYEVIAQRDVLQKANAAYTVTGKADLGDIVQPHEAKTASFNTESSPVDHTTSPSQRAVPITSSSVASPSVIVTSKPHRLTNGQRVLIAGHSGSTPSINGEHVATVIDTTSFSIPVNVTVGGTGGTLVEANTLAGATGYQQVTAFSGFTGGVGVIRHSDDDVTYVSLITFANVTAAPAKERATAAGTIRRYTAYQWTFSGGGPGSATLFCGLARN